MKITCDSCGCNMEITSSFSYHCPQCKHEIDMAHVQEANQEYWDEHKKNIVWAKIKGAEVIIIE
jgi:tRNA(Ile2) C34 agmatinyltransferase TiaS